MTGLSGSESEDLDNVSTDSGDQRPYALSQSSGQIPAGDPGLAVGAEGEADIREYGRTLGVDVDQDADLLWLVHEAFVASLPPSWTEYYDEDGRVYFYNQVTKESSWSHPMDKVFKELVELVKAVRAEQPPASKARRSEAVQAHLQYVHERAMASLDGWSGPYTSDSGTYFYNAALEVSIWDNPVDEWQGELALRQQVLHRCLLADATSSAGAASSFEGAVPGLPEAALTRLPLGLNARNPDDNAPMPVPQSPGSARSARSFLSARSTCTARSLTPTRARSRGNTKAPSPRTSGLGPVPGLESPRKVRVQTAEEAAAPAAPSPSSQPASSEVPRCSPLDELAQSEAKEAPEETASQSPATPSGAAAPAAEAQACESGAGPSCSAPDELASAAQGQPQAETTSAGAAPTEAKAPAPQAVRETKVKHEVLPRKARSVSPSKRPPLPSMPDRPTAASSARAATEDDDSDSLEFTFGRTAPVSLPKFGT